MSDKFEEQDARLENTYIDLVSSPGLYLKDLDLERGTTCFVPMTPESYARSSFLDDRLMQTSKLVYDLPLDVLLDLKQRFRNDRRAIHFIFHVGHCGSTLLSRLLGSLPGFFALREPKPLRVLARHSRRVNADDSAIDQETWAGAFDVVVGLLSRTFDTGQVTLIKPSSFCNRLIRQLLDWDPGCRAVLLHVDLESYLATMLKPENRKETNFVVSTYHQADVRHWLGDDAFDAESLPDGPKAAFVWLMNMVEFVQVMANQSYIGRLRPLEFSEFLLDRAAILSEISEFMGQAVPDDVVRAVALDPAINETYSKRQDEAFDSTAREAALASARREYADEIAAGRAWAESVCQAHPVFIDVARSQMGM